MDGVPESICRDFPLLDEPNLDGREQHPFTSFEITSARQTSNNSRKIGRLKNMDYGIDSRQEISLVCNIDDEHFSEVERLPTKFVGGYEEKDVVGISSHKTLEMNDAFVELPVDEDASTDSSETEVVQVQNPSFFSHRFSVEDLISSFRRNTIGPLAGVEIRNDSTAESSATPLIVISDAVSQRTLDCALEKWRVEQEEKELEMRWRATKRVSENWLTKVELVRERHRARREKFEREREKRKAKASGGTLASLVAKGPTSQGDNQGVISNPQPQSLVPEAHTARPRPRPDLAPFQLPVTATTSHPSPSSSQLINDSVLPHGSLRPNVPSFSLAATPVCTNCSSTHTPPREHPSPVFPKFPHAPYDPRTPDLALEELAYIPDSGQSNHMTLSDGADPLLLAGPENTTVTESTRIQQEEIQYVQQYIDVAQMSQSPLPPHCASPSQDYMSTLLLPTMDSTLLETVPEGFSGETSAHFVPQEIHPHSLQYSHPSDEIHLLRHPSVNPTPMIQDHLGIPPSQDTFPSELSAEEKMLWYIWSSNQPPPDTAEDVIHDSQVSYQSTLTPLLLRIFPFNGNNNEGAGVKVSTDDSSIVHEGQQPSPARHQTQQAGISTDSNWSLTALPSNVFPLDEAGVWSMLAPRAILINPAFIPDNQPPPSIPGSQSIGMQTASQDLSVPSDPSSVSTSRPTPILKTHDLPPPLPPSWSHIDSPLSPTSALATATPILAESSELLTPPFSLYRRFMPMGNRLFRIARYVDADVLRPSYWFEPDLMATERMRDVVNLMEGSGGWRRPDRRTRVFNGDRKARGPDDLASFDLCFGY